MNYYPSYSMNPYNMYPNMIPQQQPVMPQMQMGAGVPQSQPIQTPSLNGKIVDSEDVVKATEVPIGGYGIFPKADLSEIYIKSWNNNGTTSVITFKPSMPDPAVASSNGGNDAIETLIQKMNTLENKIDIFLNQPVVISEPQPQPKKVEVPVKNGF